MNKLFYKELVMNFDNDVNETKESQEIYEAYISGGSIEDICNYYSISPDDLMEIIEIESSKKTGGTVP